MNGKAIASA